MRLRRSDAGFTLIEVIIIVVVLGILLAAAYPALENLLRIMASKGASEEVAGAIRLARQYAITRGTSHCVEFAGTVYHIRQAPTATTCDGTILEGPITISQDLAIVTLFPAPAGGDFIVFDPIGNVTNFTPGNPAVTAGVDTVPSTCLSSVLVTLYGGVRVTRTC